MATPSPMTSARSPNAPLGLHLESKRSWASAHPGRSRADPQATPRLRANAILRSKEVSPLLYGDHRLTSEIGRNSSWRPHGAAGELDSPNCCPETRGRRRAPRGPSSFRPWHAGSTCPVRHLSSARDRIRDVSRHCCVASPIPSSYCFRSKETASLAGQSCHQGANRSAT